MGDRLGGALSAQLIALWFIASDAMGLEVGGVGGGAAALMQNSVAKTERKAVVVSGLLLRHTSESHPGGAWPFKRGSQLRPVPASAHLSRWRGGGALGGR